ncbi:Glycerol kinase [Nymphon striatum]|nr:Glycerol kinase [Nymphon striatum]
MANYILAIDQGTTSSRAIVFNERHEICGIAQQEIRQIFPHPGWVEHDPEEILHSCIETSRIAIKNAGLEGSDIAAIGITNQRETTILWDKKSGKPIYNAIVWQDRRTAEYCHALKGDGYEELFRNKTGLLLDPYFSGTKISWILNNVDDVREKAIKGELLFGTVDCWLLWNLTKGQSTKNHTHATDATNASRTLLFNIKDQQWDEELLNILDIPQEILPAVHDCASDFGTADASFFGAPIPIYGMAGDQQAATLGQACFEPGMIKSTYGTGCFAMLNTGDTIVPSSNRLLTTTAYRLNGRTTYALEGSIFIAGAAVQWLRDSLGFIERADQVDAMAKESNPDDQVYLVPAFTGMGAPYWDADARGLICGLTRSSGPNEFARASLEAVCYQTADLLKAMKKDWLKNGDKTGHTIDTILRVDGGMSASNWTMQFLADLLETPVDRPVILETTALGVAWLAGHYGGVWPDKDDFAKDWKIERQFESSMNNKIRQKKLTGWQDAVRRTLTPE